MWDSIGMDQLLMSKDVDTTKNVILYMLGKMWLFAEGKKKLMKLMFLLEYYNISSGKLSTKQFLGNDFYVYNYGVFSKDIMRSISTLIDQGKIQDGFPLINIDSSKSSLEKRVKDKVDAILDKFGKFSGYQLEVSTLKMLGIEPHEKKKYFGQDIPQILNQTKVAE